MTSPPVGVLLVNLGSPAAPTARAVRRYLAEFLADPRVVDAPRLPWWLVRNLVVLPLRSPRSARLYRRIWTHQGPPLVVTTGRLAAALATELEARLGDHAPVEAGMRYGEPSLGHALRRLAARGCGRVLVLPLFPQYSSATTASVADAVARELSSWRRLPELRLVLDYHDHPAYLAALAASVRAAWAERGRGDRLLLSFHGLPARYGEAGDPYPEQCVATARRLAAALRLEERQWSLAYQSRFGGDEWLGPATDALLRSWAAERVATVDVLCPGFAVDCLETLEEIAVGGHRVLAAAGDGQLRYIPALNDRPEHAAALAEVVVEWLAGWAPGGSSR